MVENLQKLATKYARLSLEGGADHFGEEHVLRDFEQYLLSTGLSAEDAEAAKSRLSMCDFALDPALPEDTRAIASAPVPEETGSDTESSETPTEIADSD